MRFRITLIGFLFAMMALAAGTVAEAKDKDRAEHGGRRHQKEEAGFRGEAAGSSEETLPPGLAKKDKLPPGLERKDEHPEGWSHGQKSGWKKDGSWFQRMFKKKHQKDEASQGEESKPPEQEPSEKETNDSSESD